MICTRTTHQASICLFRGGQKAHQNALKRIWCAMFGRVHFFTIFFLQLACGRNRHLFPYLKAERDFTAVSVWEAIIQFDWRLEEAVVRGQRGGGIGRKVEWGVIGKAAVLGGDVTCSSQKGRWRLPCKVYRGSFQDLKVFSPLPPWLTHDEGFCEQLKEAFCCPTGLLGQGMRDRYCPWCLCWFLKCNDLVDRVFEQNMLMLIKNTPFLSVSFNMWVRAIGVL